VFEGTNLSNDEIFGAGTDEDHTVIGYETDAALFDQSVGGAPAVNDEATREDTPENFIVLASADLQDWPGGDDVPLEFLGTAHESKWRDGSYGSSGNATMGLYHNNGTVFTAATVNWVGGLNLDSRSWTSVDQITQNILRRLSLPGSPSRHVANSGFEKWDDLLQPETWYLEGQGNIRREEDIKVSGHYSLSVDANAGQTWISQDLFAWEGRNFYRVGCWARADRRGATIRLQSRNTWRDFAVAKHSGSGEWEYLCAVGKVDDEGPMFPARVKIQVARGVLAYFDNITVEAI
jgi:hypothetical protein